MPKSNFKQKQKQKQKQKPQYAWIWPKKKSHGGRGPSSWRLWDVLFNRGPDVFVARVDGENRNNNSQDRALSRNGRNGEEKGGLGECCSCSCSCWCSCPCSWNDGGEYKKENEAENDGRDMACPLSCTGSRTQRGEYYGSRAETCTASDCGNCGMEYGEDCGCPEYGQVMQEERDMDPWYWDCNGQGYPAGEWHGAGYGAL